MKTEFSKAQQTVASAIHHARIEGYSVFVALKQDEVFLVNQIFDAQPESKSGVAKTVKFSDSDSVLYLFRTDHEKDQLAQKVSHLEGQIGDLAKRLFPSHRDALIGSRPHLSIASTK